MIDKLVKLESDFNLDIFYSKVSNVFIMMLNSIVFQDISRVYASLNEDIRNYIVDKIENLKEHNLTQLYDELNVKSISISDIEILEDRCVVKVLLVSRYLDYQIDTVTKKIKSGNDQLRVEVNNYLTFELKRNHLKIGRAMHCPNCGANIDFNYTGLCSYCNVHLDKSLYDWILIDWEI